MLPGTTIFKMIVFLAALFLCDQSNTKEQQFKTSVQAIIAGLSEQDSLKISKFVDRKTGVYLLHRIGVFDTYHHAETIDFSDSTYPQVLFTLSKGVTQARLEYSILPTFDCGKQIWSKKGLFVDTTKTDHLISEICIDRNKNRPDTISVKTIQFFYTLESKSRRIVLSENEDKELVFYLSYLNGKWYLTIIDTVTSDCSV